MNLVFFAHPSFLRQQSMQRYARMLSDGMIKRGHKVEVWCPKPRFFRFGVSRGIKKWFGYIDQYIIFPIEVRRRLNNCPENTLFVFTDHALGPWIPLVDHRPNVIHCHDFLAQLSAVGEVPENNTSWTGKQYQSFIRRGYVRGKNFISVSEKTRNDLHKFLLSPPLRSHLVYNGLNQVFKKQDADESRVRLRMKTGIDLSHGYILHIGGNQWYKNRLGVVEIYNAWRLSGESNLPLLMIGQIPGHTLIEAFEKSPFKSDIHFLTNINDELIQCAYSGACVFLFPSLAEGFGWPIAEALASGCPVITTNETPMTEVAGEAAFLIPRKPTDNSEIALWADKAAKVISRILNFSLTEREVVINTGQLNAKRFDTEIAINKIAAIYENILQKETEDDNIFSCLSKIKDSYLPN